MHFANKLLAPWGLTVVLQARQSRPSGASKLIFAGEGYCVLMKTTMLYVRHYQQGASHEFACVGMGGEGLHLFQRPDQNMGLIKMEHSRRNANVITSVVRCKYVGNSHTVNRSGMYCAGLVRAGLTWTAPKGIIQDALRISRATLCVASCHHTYVYNCHHPHVYRMYIVECGMCTDPLPSPCHPRDGAGVTEPSCLRVKAYCPVVTTSLMCWQL